MGTTIRVSDKNADRLYDLMARGDSYDDVISMLLDEFEGEGED